MPTITVSKKELEKMVGKKLPIDELKDLLLTYLKTDTDEAEDDQLTLELIDTNRPDLWSTEGLARALKNLLGIESKLPLIKTSDAVVNVEKKVDAVRPFIACAIVKNIEFTDEAITSLMQIQDKIDTSFGRRRKKTSIGIYDFDKINFPVLYTTVKPTEIKFVPLGFSEKMNLKEILEKHPKGIEFGHIIKDSKEYPILMDSSSKILSLPPIINSNDLGKVDESTKNVFVEVTGIDENAVIHVLNLVSTALAERGGDLYSVKISRKGKSFNAPDLSTKEFELDPKEVIKVTGLKLELKQMQKLLEKMGYDTKIADAKLLVEIPFYRQDILHAVDIIEDIAIAYDYNQIEPKMPEIPTPGKMLNKTEDQIKIKELMIGMGLQEILSFTLTSNEMLFKQMVLPEKPAIEIAKPVNLNYTTYRNMLMPLMLNFFTLNKTVEFPQKIFELGDIAEPDKGENKTKQIPHLCAAISHATAGFTEIKSILDTLMNNLGKEYELKPIKHPSFIEGRCGEIIVDKKNKGIIGEIHPQVLENFNLEMPVAIFEIEV